MLRLRGIVYPGHHRGPRLWLDIVSGMVDTAMGYVAVAAEPRTPDDDAGQRVRDAEVLGAQAYDLLRELDGAGPDQIPHQIVGPFQRWVDGLGVTNAIFFRAAHDANYELARFHLDRLLMLNDPAPSLLEALGVVRLPFLRLTVPSQAMGMLPHFAIVGHELGHAIQERIGFDGSRIDFSAFTAALDARLAGEGIQRSAGTDIAQQSIIASWVQEFKSDAVGVLLGGPAFLFALGGFFELAGGSYGISPTHPPSRLRRELVLRRLRRGSPSHAEIFKRHTGMGIQEDSNSPNVAGLPPDDELFRELRHEHGPEDAAICVALLTVCADIAAALYDDAEALLRREHARMIYEPEHLDIDLGTHLDPLCDLVPPIERRADGRVSAVPPAGNLNIGWAALLTRLGSISAGAARPSGDEDTPKMEKLHELLLKGVELAEARMRWDEAP